MTESETDEVMMARIEKYLENWKFDNLQYLPDHMQYPCKNYVLEGGYIGGFLTAFLTNDLSGVLTQADDVNVRHLREIAMFFWNDCPSICKGSFERIRAWQEIGGLKGYAYFLHMKPERLADWPD